MVLPAVDRGRLIRIYSASFWQQFPAAFSGHNCLVQALKYQGALLNSVNALQSLSHPNPRCVLCGLSFEEIRPPLSPPSSFSKKPQIEEGFL